MASDIIALDYSNSAFRGRIVWSSSVSGTTQTVYAELQVCKQDGYTTSGTFTYEFSLGSESETGTWYQALGQTWTKVSSLSCTISSSSCYVYGYVKGPSGTSLSTHSVSKETTITLDPIYTLTISKGTGTSITVRRTSSPVSGSTGTLSNGSAIYKGDVLTITFSALTGYNLSTHTVAGSTFSSGGSYTVSGNTSVVATASIKSYTLSISTSNGVSVTVYDEISGATYSNGSSITHFSTITITCTLDSAYDLESLTVNNVSYENGVSIEVSSDVTIVAVAKAKGIVHIFNGSSFDMYLVFIFNGSSWDMYVPYIFNGSSWDMCA